MRVLTVRQPWAWAIIHGGKGVENRTRNVAGAYRGPVAILAGRAPFEQRNRASVALKAAHGTSTPHQVVYGAIIGVVDLVDSHLGQSEVCPTPLGQHEDGTVDWAFCSPWAEGGMHHLVLANPRPLKTPLPFKGALGLRELDPDVERQVLAGVRS